ncbi:PREDICTED: fibrous sheath-interacting protein 2-like [Condylura cristata]|uniref:fibrous sheath-interacting protein 2-like n=1 Tax=Condylura cristata TaxID=143302 RepID=UPI0006428F20|nr:PREDICTED: fibrous sheath-interacting protein 2-like [Condylura cristata]
MIGKKLHKGEPVVGDQSTGHIKEEERRHQENIKRKLNLRKQIEADWKIKEMLLLKKIGEEVKREARIEEQRRKLREAADQKKQELLEKKLAYHLQKMQRSDIRKEESEKITSENNEIGDTSNTKKMTDSSHDHQSHQGQKDHCSPSFSKTSTKKISILLSHDVQSSITEQKEGTSFTLSDEGIKSTNVSAKANVSRHSSQDGHKSEIYLQLRKLRLLMTHHLKNQTAVQIAVKEILLVGIHC